MGKLADRIRENKIERRARLRTLLHNVKESPVTESLISDVAEMAQGAHHVEIDRKVEHTKGIESAQKHSISAAVALGSFVAANAGLDLSPELENIVSGAIAGAVTTLFAYISKRVRNRRKMRALERD